MVICTGFRNPALTAKLASTIDVICGGRFELGIGAGWKEDEWRAYGYGFPPLRRAAGRARRPPRGHSAGCSNRAGPHTRASTRACAGRSTNPRASRSRTSRSSSAATAGTSRSATPPASRTRSTWSSSRRTAWPSSCRSSASAARRSAATRPRCASRSTRATTDIQAVGQERVDILGAFAALGLDRIVCFPSRWDLSLEGQAAFAADCRAAGLEMAPAGADGAGGLTVPEG